MYFRDPETLNLSNITGFILNIPTDYKFGIVTIPYHRRHWVAIRQIHGQYFNLDSKNEAPQVLGDVSIQNHWKYTVFIFHYFISEICFGLQESKLILYLRTELANNDRELFVVVSQEVEKNQSWLTSSSKDEGRTWNVLPLYVECGF